MRETLLDREIPHRSKIREAILTALREWFFKLKIELKVCSSW
jgi:hypothetical protein